MPNRLMPTQVRGARGMLDWSMLDLAKAAGVSVSTVKRVEDGRVQLVSDGTRLSIRGAFETAGVCFLMDDGNGPGLRLSIRCERATPPSTMADVASPP